MAMAVNPASIPKNSTNTIRLWPRSRFEVRGCAESLLPVALPQKAAYQDVAQGTGNAGWLVGSALLSICEKPRFSSPKRVM